MGCASARSNFLDSGEQVIDKDRKEMSRMVEKFEIGEQEKHLIIVNWTVVTKRMTVKLDGQTVFNKGFVFSPLKQKFHFDAGTSETHRVEVGASPFSPIKVLVDGRPAQPLL